MVLSYILLASIALGQSNLTASANVSITIVKALQIEQIQGDLNFGELVQSGVSSKLQRTPDKGILFAVTGNAGKNVVVDYHNTLFNNRSASQNNSSQNSIQFIPEINTTYSNSSYSNAQSVINGSSYPLQNKDGFGVLYLWVGGEMDIDSKLASGDYTGEFAVTVSY